MDRTFRIFAINSGSTSLKAALFENDAMTGCEQVRTYTDIPVWSGFNAWKETKR